MRGYRAFAVQHQGWCATGPKAHVTYRRYGRSNRCRNGKGGPWANDVYVVSGKCIFDLIDIMLMDWVEIIRRKAESTDETIHNSHCGVE